MSTAKRKIRVVSAAFVLVAVACTGGDDETRITPQPTDRPDVESVAEFQLVGRITKAFAGAEPPVATDAQDEVAGPTPSPDASPDASTAGDPADVPGVLRIAVEDASDDLRDGCGIAAEQEVSVHWVEGTRFGTADGDLAPSQIELDRDTFEDELEDRVAGVSGRIFRAADTDTDVVEDTPEPARTAPPTDTDLAGASPFAIGSPDTGGVFGSKASDCVLIADLVGFETDEVPPATRAPSVARTAAPTARATDTPEPDETDDPKPTRTPAETDEPATSTAEGDG